MIYRFGPFELDMAKFELRADGEVRAVEPRVLALLALLVENRERLVSKEEIVEKVWDGRAISEAAVATGIKSARKALGDDGTNQRFVKTVHGRGFRFVAQTRTVGIGPAAVPMAPSVNPQESPGSRPSLAVLPFRPIGAALAHAAIADALPDDLITELARLRWLFITARGSSFRLRGADADIEEVGRLLGVRYCLSGTVEIAGAALAVTARLADTRDGGVIWAERFAGSVDDVHQIRGEIRSLILSALEVQIPLHEAARARLAVTESLDAWSAYHLGLQHVYRFTRKDTAAAAALFHRAIAQDPGFARAHAGLSFVHFQAAFMHHTDDLAGEIALARQCSLRALDLDPIDPFVNFTMGRTFWLEGDLESGLLWLERATAISPNYAQGIYARAWTEALSGRGLEGREHVDLAMRLSPIDPLHYAMLATRALSHMVMGEHGDAMRWAERAARSPSAHVLIALIAVAAHALAGEDARAAAWANNVRSRNPALTRQDFFRAFPMQPEATKLQVSQALGRFGF